MTDPGNDETETRVLVLAPTGRDAALACRVLEEAGIHAKICVDLEELRSDIRLGAGAVLLTEEALRPRAVDELRAIFSSQLPWSDLPILVFSAGEASGDAAGIATRKLGMLANVTLLDRPTRKVTLVSAVRSALRARHRQYEVRDLVIQLERGVRYRDQFLAMLGHELRNPLGAILTSAQLMEQENPKAFARERAVIHRQTRILSRLVDDLLDVSRVTSGKITLDRTSVDLRELLDRCVQAHAVTASDRRIDLVLSFEDRAVVDGDPVRLEQIVNNLLTNALKYTPSGGRVEVTLSRAGDQVEIRVRDTGVGIDPEILPRVFDLFTQADNALDRSQGGLGIGLTLVRSLVGLHGGTVWAESRGRGEGSVFVVQIPAADAIEPGKRPRQRPRARPRARRILLIEDNVDMREGLRQLLEEVGHRVFAAGDGAEGIEIAYTERPEVALVDIGLPTVDGYAVARLIRGALGSGIFLVALTGYGLPEDRRRALEAGFDDHLTKPITLNAILDLLARSQSKSGTASQVEPENVAVRTSDPAALPRRSGGDGRRNPRD